MSYRKHLFGEIAASHFAQKRVQSGKDKPPTYAEIDRAAPKQFSTKSISATLGSIRRDSVGISSLKAFISIKSCWQGHGATCPYVQPHLS
ncbi:MAG: hypothetical protein KC423_28685, partial [Anaerolineales bacterium]|nr:hypothetical protein [Anaerolineales bacterium]